MLEKRYPPEILGLCMPTLNNAGHCSLVRALASATHCFGMKPSLRREHPGVTEAFSRMQLAFRLPTRRLDPDSEANSRLDLTR